MVKEVKLYVLDTSALFAFLDDEDGAGVVEDLLKKAQKGEIGIIVPLSCLGEVYYITKQRKGVEEAKKVTATVKEFPVELAGLSEEEILFASDFKADYSISLADSYVAGIASLYKAIVVTKDPEFKEIEKDKKLEFLWIQDR